MCRWLAYSGSPVFLEQALYSPAHSLIDQSLHSELGAEATNGDGFGVGWYDDTPTPGVFRSIEPAWNDQNLRELSAHVTSGRFFAHIRAAIGSPVQQTNCHPFRHGRWLFMHNGYIAEFPRVKRDLVLAVDESLYPEIAGQADTELLFYLALTFGLEDDPPEAVARAIGLVEQVGARQGHQVPVPGHDRHHRRRADVGVPLLERRQVAFAVLHRQRGHAARSSTRTERSSRRSPMMPGSSCPSRSATSPAPGMRCPSRLGAWSARARTRWRRSRSSRRPSSCP